MSRSLSHTVLVHLESTCRQDLSPCPSRRRSRDEKQATQGTLWALAWASRQTAKVLGRGGAWWVLGVTRGPAAGATVGLCRGAER